MQRRSRIVTGRVHLSSVFRQLRGGDGLVAAVDWTAIGLIVFPVVTRGIAMEAMANRRRAVA